VIRLTCGFEIDAGRPDDYSAISSTATSSRRRHETHRHCISSRLHEFREPAEAVARRLGISFHTVKFHVAGILTKLASGKARILGPPAQQRHQRREDFT